MPTLQIQDDSHGKQKLTDRDFVASGGEGSVYQNNGIAYKIYHDPKRCIPVGKIQELSELQSPNILGPRSVVRDLKKQNPIGFSMPFASGTVPICKLFTKTFRNQSGFSETDAVDLVAETQKVVNFVHSKKCLIVDLNEYAILVGNGYKTPYFIDVDSWQTPSFKATALMESVRDRKVVNQQFTEGSDWFSWGIVVFQLYIGIHPYKGKHPDFSPKEWSERMDQNVSVFDKKAGLPASCRPFDVIPKLQLNWFIDTFRDGHRSVPPLPDAIAPMPVEVAVVVIKGTENFNAERVGKYHDPVVYAFGFGSENYTLTTKQLYAKSRGVNPTRVFTENAKRFVFNSGIGEAFLACHKDKTLTIELTKQKFGEDPVVVRQDMVSDIFVRDGRLYSITGERLMEHVFVSGKKVLHSFKSLGTVLPNATKVFSGCVYQSLLGEPAFMIPYDEGKIYFKIIKELAGYRIVDAKSEDNVLVVLGEKKGKHTRFVFVFDSEYKNYTVRTSENVDLEPINFTKIPGRVCVLYAGNETLEIFVDNSKVKTVEKAPLDADMKLFNSEGKIFFMSDNEIYRLDMIK